MHPACWVSRRAKTNFSLNGTRLKESELATKYAIAGRVRQHAWRVPYPEDPPLRMTGAVILAAGGSSRFGEPKQLISFRGKRLVRRIVDAARRAGCSPIVAVVGSDSETIRHALKRTKAVIVDNGKWKRGIGSSIRIGVEVLIKEGQSPLTRRSAPKTADHPVRAKKADSVSRRRLENRRSLEAVVLLACDQPFVDANTIRNLIELRKKTKQGIVASSYANTLGVPALFSRSFFQELLSLGDEAGAKSIILRNRKRVVEFPFPEGAIDVDTWDDWEKVKE